MMMNNMDNEITAKEFIDDYNNDEFADPETKYLIDTDPLEERGD